MKTHGTTSATRTSRSGEIQAADQTLTTYRYNGTSASLRAIQPKKGADFDGKTVLSSRLTPKEGGLADLEIVCRKKRRTAHGLPAGALDRTWEVEMMQVDKPLMSLEPFAGYSDQIELWRESAPELRAQFKFISTTGQEQTLAGYARKAAEKIMKGIESVAKFYPVITVTTTYEDEPKHYAQSIGKRNTPPDAGSVPGNNEWLKIADKAVHSADDTWDRIERWQGVPLSEGGVDHDLYEAG